MEIKIEKRCNIIAACGFPEAPLFPQVPMYVVYVSTTSEPFH
jgi:hypothetical protein